MRDEGSFVDVLDWASTSAEFRRIVEAQHVVVQRVGEWLCSLKK